jgi:hypothetical protein
MGHGKDQVTPSELRKAIAQARSSLGAHLRSLSNLALPSVGTDPGEKMMQTKKKAPANAKVTNKSKADAKSSPAPKPKAAATKKTSAGRKSGGVAAKAGHVLDTMAAGAVIGAVKAAAQSIAQNETKSLKGSGKRSKSTSDVLSEIAPGAAVGAVAGAARAVVPDNGKAKGKAAKGTKR